MGVKPEGFTPYMGPFLPVRTDQAPNESKEPLTHMRMQWVHPLHSVHVGVHAAPSMHEVLRILRQPLRQTVTVLTPEDVPDGTRAVTPVAGATLGAVSSTT